MKGLLYTVSVFLIMLGIVAYIFTVTGTNLDKSKAIADKVSAERVYYAWRGTQDSFQNIMNITPNKNDDIAEFNDTLPAPKDIRTQLNNYQNFIKNYYSDPTISVRFEDTAGTEITLGNLPPQVAISPMNIVYSWPSFAKKELDINVDPANFSYIKNVTLYLKMKNAFFDCTNTCTDWDPNWQPCGNTQYCLKVNLTVEDKNGVVKPYPQYEFDVNRVWTNNLPIKNETHTGLFLKIQFGDLTPGGTVMHIDLKDTQVDTSTKIGLNTTDFFINYPAKLNVTTDFARKVDWL